MIDTIEFKTDKVERPKYWMYSASEKSSKWEEFYREGIMAIGWDYLGDLTRYHSQEEITNRIKKEENRDNNPTNDSKANWEFANDMQIDDIVYVKKGPKDAFLIGRGIVKSNYIYDENRSKYRSIRKVQWTHKGTYGVDFTVLDIKQWNQKTLTNISRSKYGDFCLKIEDVFMNKQAEEKLNNSQVDIPLNQILYGPPGTGKTYNTLLRAMSIIDGIEYKNVSDEKYSELKQKFDALKKEGQIEFITFHQSYSYEEFVEGIKPSTDNEDLIYEKVNGIFKNICERARGNSGDNFNEVYENFINDLAENQPLMLKTKGGKHFGIKLNSKKNLTLLMGENLQPWATLTKHNLKNLSDWKYYANPIQDCLKEKYGLFFATNTERKPHILIIDEINRGNISKIFGELITLIEEDKRENLSVVLPYSQEEFAVPKNLYIIGTMNTSDRSIASIDIALRRRFRFIEMMPQKELVADFNIDFAHVFKELNTKIKILLDRDHQIGHSYFIKTKYGNAGVEVLKTIWFNEILPLLNEYFYCDWEKLKLVVPGFIKKLEIPSSLKSEYDEEIYEFKTPDEVKDFAAALKCEEFGA